MALMVYIKEIQPRSFLHFSTSGESFCLRDFSHPGSGPAIELVRQTLGRTASTIRELASNPGNHMIEVPGAGNGVEKYAFWHTETLKLNARYIEAAVSAPAIVPRTVKSWCLDHLTTIVVWVIIAVVSAAILAWLGFKQ